MQLLYFFESIRNPVLDALFSLITHLGEETVFLVMLLILFWCVDKRAGYLVSIVGFSGIFINQCLKMTFRVPRPWDLDPNFTIVESARAAATGYSFPSGHTQNAVGAFGALGLWYHKQPWVKYLCLFAVVAVPISRMYLGVHTPADVGVSFIIAILLAIGGYYLMRKMDIYSHNMGWVVLAVVALGVAGILYISLFPYPSDVDMDHVEHSITNAWKLGGAALGMVVGWWIDRKYLRYQTKAVWYAQILKAVGGAIIVFALKALIKIPLKVILPDMFEGGVRYFLLVVIGLAVWPMTFPWFARMGTPKTPVSEDAA